jgi:hypothetical protein
MAFCVKTFGQEAVHEIWDINKNTRIALSDIIGDWYSSDSTQSKITFAKLGNNDVILEGKRDGIHNYHFILDTDSINVNGVAANWPPYYCTLMLYNNDILEIKYYQFHSSETSIFIYKRS